MKKVIIKGEIPEQEFEEIKKWTQNHGWIFVTKKGLLFEVDEIEEIKEVIK